MLGPTEKKVLAILKDQGPLSAEFLWRPTGPGSCRFSRYVLDDSLHYLKELGFIEKKKINKGKWSITSLALEELGK